MSVRSPTKKNRAVAMSICKGDSDCITCIVVKLKVPLIRDIFFLIKYRDRYHLTSKSKVWDSASPSDRASSPPSTPSVARCAGLACPGTATTPIPP